MSPHAPSDRWGQRSALLLGAFTIAVCIFLISPILVVFLSSLTTVEYVSFPPVGLSLRWYGEVLSNDEFSGSLLVSLRLALMSAAIATSAGVLAAIGIVRVVLWHDLFGYYGDEFSRIALAVGLSLVGVVAWGTLSGSMLPLLLRRIGFDPAHASAPLVATLVDVSGLVIYFSIAAVVLSAHFLPG